ncbi:MULTISPECIES: phosphotransferase family protein [Oceanobacillus]|uniref:Phosphotransferase n=1 Tax=Oceanobacillus kimchii TaxID=746691 RepID=A0ABQ5TJB7_9BACI|nr:MULTISPECIES: phosphotransferase family protein [Oceanobacillus]MBT2600703.1 phosphotransferase family protein [Oceanobacillus sp. ISL-74]MBT2650900.1 phosphotransferase family protein [Oceanobacillus sp. ISL-73]MCT1575458.1 phosphotransferase family protein [Oceanobacillus kimchii]MCT2138031.1 phosphotransferase family protein [Oceanobacillus kimchii]OEH55276.1 phosphotransferase [Oceanobacillus sp. E9]
MIKWLEQALGTGWNITPAGGLTGDAFIAEKNGRRLFLKRNSSPFLAVLSAEGIVPKLIWTKRMENGDVITAQEWLEGRSLNVYEMQQQNVADLLNKIHHSTELLHMLLRMGKKPVTSDESLKSIKYKLDKQGMIDSYSEVIEAIHYLEKLLPETRDQQLAVCHCDINHNNLILTSEENIFLVDWDNAMIADPATDIGMLLKWYLPKEDWVPWLKQYGIEPSQNLFTRMYWYLLHDSLHFLSWHNTRNEPEKVRQRLWDLQELNDQIRSLF